MKRPAFRRSATHRSGERGITMILVAVSMVAIISMAALSIDVATLYVNREEAQRSADAAALAAARVLSLTGVTGDPDNVQGSLPSSPWPAACSAATQVAQAVANPNAVGGTVANTVTVTFLYNGATTDCTSTTGGFGINPQVQVKVIRQGLPTFFSRIWSRGSNSVSATATAEAFNPSHSGTIAPNGIVPVNPRCVKPWIVPNRDPGNPGAAFVSLIDGSIQNPGIQPDGTGSGGVIGESFTLTADCKTGNPNCKWGGGDGLQDNPPSYNKQGANTLDYVPTLVQPTAVAYPTCADDSDYQKAIGGCDQSTVYACGIVGGGVQADLSFNPGQPSGDTSTATKCLIHQQVGQDVLDRTVFPFQIHAGLGNPVVTSGVITSSTSLATVPIYDDTQVPVLFPTGVNQTPVTIVGFLQVFINDVDSSGNPNVTVLNVAGCSNTAITSTATVSGTSPVPIRLITP
jgi:Flp pilus assembly protein TadG